MTAVDACGGPATQPADAEMRERCLIFQIVGELPDYMAGRLGMNDLNFYRDAHKERSRRKKGLSAAGQNPHIYYIHPSISDFPVVLYNWVMPMPAQINKGRPCP